jgi:hypothetical protein
MSNPTVAKPPDPGKAEPPPIVAMLRTLEDACAERDRIVVENVAALTRTLEGRE